MAIAKCNDSLPGTLLGNMAIARCNDSLPDANMYPPFCLQGRGGGRGGPSHGSQGPVYTLQTASQAGPQYQVHPPILHQARSVLHSLWTQLLIQPASHACSDTNCVCPACTQCYFLWYQLHISSLHSTTFFGCSELWAFHSTLFTWPCSEWHFYSVVQFDSRDATKLLLFKPQMVWDTGYHIKKTNSG